jgi:hypothetical protein
LRQCRLCLRLQLCLERLPIDVVLKGRRPSSPPQGQANGLAARRSKQRRQRTLAIVRPLAGSALLRTLRADDGGALLLRRGSAGRTPAA